MIQNGTSVLDHLKDQSLDGYLSQGWGFMQIANHLSAQDPEVVHMFRMVFLDSPRSIRCSRKGRK